MFVVSLVSTSKFSSFFVGHSSATEPDEEIPESGEVGLSWGDVLSGGEVLSWGELLSGVLSGWEVFSGKISLGDRAGTGVKQKQPREQHAPTQASAAATAEGACATANHCLPGSEA